MSSSVGGDPRESGEDLWGEDEALVEGLTEEGLEDLTAEQVRSVAVRSLPSATPRGMVSGPPLPVSEEVVTAARQRYYQFLDDQLRAMAMDALKVYSDILTDPNVDRRLKKSTADSVLDRALGKSPEKVQLTIETKPWQKILTAIVYDDEFFERNDITSLKEAARRDEKCEHRDWSGNVCGRDLVPGSKFCKQHSRVWQNGESPNYPWGEDGEVVEGQVRRGPLDGDPR